MRGLLKVAAHTFDDGEALEFSEEISMVIGMLFTLLTKTGGIDLAEQEHRRIGELLKSFRASIIAQNN